MVMPVDPTLSAPPPVRAGDGRELVLRHVLFFHRHGDRSPVLPDLGSKCKMTPEELRFWSSRVATAEQLQTLNRAATVVGATPRVAPYGTPKRSQRPPLGQLTATGVDHMTTRGRQLREHYRDFLESSGVAQAPHDQVYVLSSNIVRTIQSVQCLLVGMFHDHHPASEEAEADKPVFFVRTYERNVLAPDHRTSLFNEIERIVSEEVAQREAADRAAITALGDSLKQVLGIPVEQDVPWTAIRDTLTCRDAHALPFPEGVTREMYALMQDYDTWLWHTLYARHSFCHGAFAAGVREVSSHLQGVVRRLASEQQIATSGSVHDDDHGHGAKLAFFSAHDNSIVALISALQLSVGRVLPGYGTLIAFEVYEDVSTSPSAFYLRVLMEGVPVVFQGHEHDALCPFDHFELKAQQFLQPVQA